MPVIKKEKRGGEGVVVWNTHRQMAALLRKIIFDTCN